MLERRSDVGLASLAQDEDVEYAIYRRTTPITGVICFKERKTASQATRTLWKATKFTLFADCTVIRAGKMITEIEYCKKDGPGSFVEIGEIRYKKNQPISLLIDKFKATVDQEGKATPIEFLRRKHPYVFKKYPELTKEYLIKTLGRDGYYEKLKPTGKNFPPGTCKTPQEVFEKLQMPPLATI